MGDPAEVAEEESLARDAVVAGRYRVIRPLAEGGMGQVYVAHDERVGRDVALKVLRREFSARKDLIGRFRKEAKAASAVKHESILVFTDCGFDGTLKVYFVCSELLEGEELRSLMQKGALTKPDLFEILLQVSSAMEAAHRKGVVHRDLKPENIFVTRDRRGVLAKVLDFGIAKVLDETATQDTRTRTNVVIGTPGYMSPEQHMAKPVDGKTDVFALGCILYECLTGREPFKGNSLQAITIAMMQRTRKPLEDSELEAIVAQALAWEHDNRTPSARAFADALESYQTRHPEVTWVAHAPSITPAPPSGVGNNLPTPAEPATSSLAPNPVIEISRPPASQLVVEPPRKPTVTSWSGEAPILPPSFIARHKWGIGLTGVVIIATALVLLALPHKQAPHARLVATAPVTVVNPSDAATVVATPTTDANTAHPVARTEAPSPTPTTTTETPIEPVAAADPPTQTPVELPVAPLEESRRGRRDRRTLREQRNGHAPIASAPHCADDRYTYSEGRCCRTRHSGAIDCDGEIAP